MILFLVSPSSFFLYRIYVMQTRCPERVRAARNPQLMHFFYVAFFFLSLFLFDESRVTFNTLRPGIVFDSLASFFLVLRAMCSFSFSPVLGVSRIHLTAVYPHDLVGLTKFFYQATAAAYPSPFSFSLLSFLLILHSAYLAVRCI